MDNRKTILNKFVSRAWVPVLVLVVGFVVWQVYRVLPVWLEQKVRSSLRDQSIVVAAFPIEQIGFRRTTVGKGSLLFSDSSLGWDAIVVEYQLDNLLRGQLYNVEVQSPMVAFKLDSFWQPTAVYPEVDIAAGTIIEEDQLQQPKASPDSGPQAPMVPQADSGPAEQPEITPMKRPGAWEVLQDLPVSLFGFRDGLMDIQLHGMSQFSAEINGQLENQPFGISGDMLLSNPQVSMHVSLRAPVAEQVVTLQAESAMPPGAVRTLGNQFIELLENCDTYPRIASSGQLVLDLFAENKDGEPLYGSAQASLDELTLLLPESEFEVALDDILVAGVFKESSLELEGGFETLFPIKDNLRVEPFGLRFSIKDTHRVTIETEIVDWNYSGLSARCAVLGKLDLETYPVAGWGRVETSFSRFEWGAVTLEPFSILVSPDNQILHFEASPVGLVQSGTFWLEDIKGYYDLDAKTGHGHFQWYGLFAEELGTGVLDISPEEDITRYRFKVMGKTADKGIQGVLEQSGEKSSLEMSGELVLPWINTLASWFGYGSFKLGGMDPRMETHLEWQYPLLTGTGKLVLDGVDLSMNNGTRFKGISGTIDYEVLVMPKTKGRQITRIQRLVSDPVELTDIEIEWELKNIRELVVHRMTGRIGEGIVELQPFTLDPLKPDLKTSIIIKRFDADLLRQWLKEDRFSIQGSIAGQIPIGWINGEVVFGSGTFDMDSGVDSGLLRFRDENFLKEKFASLGGIPVDLKERLLNALWQNGIRMDALQIYLGSTKNEDELSFRIAVNGETGNELLEFPIGGFVINNLISLDDLAVLLNMVAPIRIDPNLGKD